MIFAPHLQVAFLFKTQVILSILGVPDFVCFRPLLIVLSISNEKRTFCYVDAFFIHHNFHLDLSFDEKHNIIFTFSGRRKLFVRM